MQAALADRFWPHVQKTDDCWIWTGSLLRNGYGQIEVRNSTKRYVWTAHRLSWYLHNGAIPKDLFVCHHCDVRSCVNPAHLFLGTNRDNIHDAMQKGRVPQLTDAAYKARGDRHASKLYPNWGMRGEQNGFAKLTTEAVLDICARYASGGVTMKTLALTYSVTKSAIWRVIHRCNWRHLAITVSEPSVEKQLRNRPKKLSDEQVVKIRQRYDSEHIRQTELAKEYHVCPSTICEIVHRNKRNHIIDNNDGME